MTAPLAPSAPLAPLAPVSFLTRVLAEGYGDGAWYGADLRTAVSDVPSTHAFRRPADGRHNIAEIALHHAYWATQITQKLTGQAQPFPLEGEDWFELTIESRLSWADVKAALEAAWQGMVTAVEATATGRVPSPLSDRERLDLVVGIAGHAAYHAGQVQLVKKLI